MTSNIGVDILAIDRIRKALKAGDSYLDYMFCQEERMNAQLHPRKDYYYASLFAIKEATFKSLNIYWQEDMAWTDFVVNSLPDSAPTITLVGQTDKIAQKKGVQGFSTSNSYDGDYMIATTLCHFKKK